MFTNRFPHLRSRDSARLLLFDQEGALILIGRSRPGREPYLVTVGGGLDPFEDEEMAARREALEEVGAADIVIGPVVHVEYDVHEADQSPSAQTFFLARVTKMDWDNRTGSEFARDDRGDYSLERISVDDPRIDRIQPPAISVLVQKFGYHFQELAKML
ncbi:NUDIX domain-containing protein [Devriesea agamarum]|uniref:NUDIX domain-containing protein n=1 Tax=Devriesea agamarum TaxID=472569 RepID=UPI00071DCBB0|nr:NUDIX domain-containing protein [Devriesea agamarum]